MFVSFFPRPKLFFWSAVVWTALSMALWYGYVNGLVESVEARSCWRCVVLVGALAYGLTFIF